MNTRIFPVMALLMMGLTACTLTGPGLQKSGDDLREARRAWRQLGVSDYDMSMNRGCFCIGAGSMEVYVRGDSVAAVLQEQDFWNGNEDWWQYIPTVEGLFDLVDEASEDAFTLEVEYHSQHGYPTSVSIDWIENAVDDEISYSITALSLAPEGDLIQLSVGEEVLLPSGHSVRLDRIAEDSRCALNVQCVWAGRVQAVLAVSQNGPATETVLTHGSTIEGDSDTATVLGLIIRVVSVTPYPADADTPIDPSAYRVHLITSAN